MIDVKQLRNELNISQEQLASILGTSTRTIQNWEAGKVIPKSKYAMLKSLMSSSPAQIDDRLPNISAESWRTGSASSGDSQTLIPLVHIDSVGGIRSMNQLTSSEQYIERMIPFPDGRPGDVAIIQSGNSMAPTIPAGAILQIRKVEGWREYFGYGNDFVLWLSDDRRITKQVLKYSPDPKNYVTCHSYNPESADEELPKDMIQEVWKVVNVLIHKGW
ncbi:MAG: helix-turn-helix transcriptional regulator [Treponema sp.]|nr:helix-turn-helix transcriptional regulator [Treponema sp.]